MELKCSVQSYDWGKRGGASIVANLAKTADSSFEINETKPYAELWMGTHPNGPSFLKDENVSLENHIKEHSEVLGSAVQEKFGDQLPFLFKVLSVRTALSIQAHPNKKHAEELFRTRPDLYKDPNHKPELAIALTQFEALCGFRPVSEIKQYFQTVPELRVLAGEERISELATSDEAGLQDALKNCFRSIMTRDSETVQCQVQALLERLTSLDEAARQAANAHLVEKLHSQFPGDVGCFGVYLFNLLSLEPGEALFLAPNEPHAYLSGDCLECMACSDNVVRAGLTPKFKDVDTLVEMLTYNCSPASDKRFQPTRDDDCTETFRPPIPDFAVAKITVPSEQAIYKLIPRSTASILIVIDGEAELNQNTKHLKPGSVLFLAANEVITVTVSPKHQSLSMCQAFVNV